MYSLEELKKLNPSNSDMIDENIVSKVNEIVEILEEDKDFPTVGSGIRFTSPHGDFYSEAFVDRSDSDSLRICESASVHVSFFDREKKELCFSVSGGAFENLPKGISKNKGKTKHCFWTWGNRGACGNGGIYFNAEISSWEINLNEGKYSTEFWSKEEFYFHPEGDKYLCSSSRNFFKSEKELIQYLFKNKSEVEISGNFLTAWKWKTYEVFHRNRDEYDALDLKKATQYENGRNIEIKIDYIESKREIIKHYAFYNDGKESFRGLPTSMPIAIIVPEEIYNKYKEGIDDAKRNIQGI